jgi:hypothetical protein
MRLASRKLFHGSNNPFDGLGKHILSDNLIVLKSIRRYAGAPRVLMFNQNFSRSSPRDPYPLLKVIHEGLRADSPVVLQGVIFCTDQLGDSGEEKPGMIPPILVILI